MPTARELLEQADALMRRNRRDDAVTAPPAGKATDDPLRGLLPDAPTQDEVHAIDVAAPLTPTVILPDHGDSDATDWLASLADLPILTDVVEIGADALVAPGHADAAPFDVAAPSEAAAPSDVTAPSEATDECAVSGEDPAALRDAPRPEPPAQVTEAQSAAEWSALAEEIRAQVLQRLDLFTDTGLREQLGAHLMPIVERASAELVDTINRQVGELVRSYVAEAIEREIEAWRNRGA